MWPLLHGVPYRSDSRFYCFADGSFWYPQYYLQTRSVSKSLKIFMRLARYRKTKRCFNNWSHNANQTKKKSIDVKTASIDWKFWINTGKCSCKDLTIAFFLKRNESWKCWNQLELCTCTCTCIYIYIAYTERQVWLIYILNITNPIYFAAAGDEKTKTLTIRHLLFVVKKLLLRFPRRRLKKPIDQLLKSQESSKLKRPFSSIVGVATEEGAGRAGPPYSVQFWNPGYPTGVVCSTRDVLLRAAGLLISVTVPFNRIHWTLRICYSQ